jgi:hypothetical protein
MVNFKVLAVIGALLGSTAHAQSTVEIPLSEAREVATRALFAGDERLALQIAQTILSQQPDDRESLMIVAAAAPRTGDPRTGRLAGTRAWALSETDVQKYEAARLTALAAANEERFTLSTFWLRRALTVVPNDAERTRTLTDARAVKQRNPWSSQLSFSLVPSNNVNGGTEGEESTAPGNPTGSLSPDALALRGWRASLSFGAQYRLHQTATNRTTVGLQSRISRVRLSEDSIVPDESFKTAFYEFSARHDRVLENGTITFRASRGLFDYRDLDLIRLPTPASEPAEFEVTGIGRDNYKITRLGIDRQIPLSERTLLTLSGTEERLTYSNPGIGEVERTIFRTGLNYRLGNGNRVSGSLSYVDSEGDSVNYTSEDKIISASYSWAEPIGPVSLSIGAGVKQSEYPEYRLLFPVEGGRKDKTVFANVNIGFPQIEYAGFSPGLRIDASKAESNVSRFERTSVSIGFTINSAF